MPKKTKKNSEINMDYVKSQKLSAEDKILKAIKLFEENTGITVGTVNLTPRPQEKDKTFELKGVNLIINIH